MRNLHTLITSGLLKLNFINYVPPKESAHTSIQIDGEDMESMGRLNT